MNPNTAWKNWQPAACLPDCWCELPRYGQWIVEPSNTWSNLIYILVGIAIYYHSRHKDRLWNNHLMKRKPLYYTMFSFGLVFVGLGSGWFHASQTHVGQWFDNIGMYFITNFFIVYNLDRVFNYSNKGIWTRYLAMTIPMMISAYFIPETRRYLFALSLLIAVIITLWANSKVQSRFQTKYFLGAIALYMVAQTAWIIDRFKIICEPSHWLNGHSIWHLFAGLACYCYLYFLESETAITEAKERAGN